MGFFGVRAGYNIDEAARVDLSYHYFGNAGHDKKISTKLNASQAAKLAFDTGKAVPAGTKLNQKFSVDYHIHNILVNGYYDFLDLGMAKLYGGAGVGIGIVSGNVKYVETADSINHKTTQKTKIAAQAGFAYQLSLGASAEVTPGLNLDLAYNWRGLKTGGIKVKGGGKIKGALNATGFSLGLRYDI